VRQPCSGLRLREKAGQCADQQQKADEWGHIGTFRYVTAAVKPS
jgi:hypothetical protein